MLVRVFDMAAFFFLLSEQMPMQRGPEFLIGMRDTAVQGMCSKLLSQARKSRQVT
jgi:hypothetical protein